MLVLPGNGVPPTVDWLTKCFPESWSGRLGRKDNVMNPKKVLIVDDDPVTVDLVSRLINDAGYDILTAVDGSQAVSVARQERPDLILLDLIFPPDVAHGGGITWDGFLIMDWLRRVDEAKDIPIFIMSMGDPNHFRNIAFAKGAAAFFPKPINGEELVATVRNVLGAVETDTSLLVRLDLHVGR
jgi:CheY-like chemotaxis protein